MFVAKLFPKKAVLVGIAAFAAMTVIEAKAAPFSVDLTAGTGGLGGELSYRGLFGVKSLALRGGVEAFDYSDNVTYDGISYSGKLKLGDLGGYLDYTPFGQSGLVLSVGVQSSQRKLSLTATPSTTVQINSVSYTPAKVGTLNGSAELSKVTPYLGLGWRQPVLQNLFLKLDAGVAIGERPKTALTSSTGLVKSVDLAGEERKINGDTKYFGAYPLITVGLGYRF